MQIKFTVNITDVENDQGDPIETTDEHYHEFINWFREEYKDVQHELTFGDYGLRVLYEMEDIEVVVEQVPEARDV